MYKKNIVRIPRSIIAVYSKEKKLITFIGPAGSKSLKLKLQLRLKQLNSSIEVTNTYFCGVSNKQVKQKGAIRNTMVALLKQLMLESLSSVYEKLKFVGVGYRSLEIINFNSKLFLFKLGLSHPLYYQTPIGINIKCLKFTKLFIHGSYYQYVAQVSSDIRACKKPEPYKGKGILYESEKIELKIGKRV